MAGSGDLVGGRYPLGYTYSKFVAGEANASQANINPRSNLELPGIGSLQDAAAALTSGKATLVPVPVEIGDEYNYVDVLVGATAASTLTHSWAALYNSAGTLIGKQSADGTTAAMAASGRFTFTLGEGYIVGAADAPYGFLYAAVSVTASTVPSLVSGSVPTAVQYAWYTNMPAFLAGVDGSALGGAAPATITLSGVTSQAAVPVVALR